MPIPIAIPIVGGVAVLSLVGLRIAALSKNKAAPAPPVVPSPPTPAPKAQVVPPTPPAIAAQLPPVTTNPDGTPHQEGTPFVFTDNSSAANAVAEANRLGISVHELVLRQQGQLPATVTGSAAVAGKRGVVTTNDPAPAGDLIIRTAPNPSAPTIAGGGADKGGTLTVIRDVDDTWAEVDWPGGRRPAGRGFARKAFIRLI